jgi:5-carboxymethyl-2-hydroxymuconate isomerase
VPHVWIENAGNLEKDVDMPGLCEAIRAEAARIEIFSTPRIRVRACRADHYTNADGDKKNGFVDISVSLRCGRPLDVRQDATARISEPARACLAAAVATRSIALSLEMRDIDPELSPKAGTTRDSLPGPSGD